MILAAEGLLVAVVFWTTAMLGIVWSWNRHVPIVVAAGFHVDQQYQRIGLREVSRRHTPGWTAFFVGMFLVMELSDFPLWQRLGIAVMLAVFYGLSRIRRGEAQWVAKNEPGLASMFGTFRDRIWYRLLAIAEWTGYLCTIAFLTQIIGQWF